MAYTLQYRLSANEIWSLREAAAFGELRGYPTENGGRIYLYSPQRHQRKEGTNAHPAQCRGCGKPIALGSDQYEVVIVDANVSSSSVGWIHADICP